MDFIDKIKEKTELKNVTVVSDRNLYKSSSIGEILLENNYIDSCKMEYIRLSVESKNQIAEARICLFENNISYIQSLRVEEKYRNKKIGTNFLRYILTNVVSNHNRKIFIKPTSDSMKHICKKHFDFSKSNIQSWYSK